jgi:NADH-quinone oxidoreductase subunit G
VRSSLETQAVLARAAKIKGWRGPAFFADSATARKVQIAVSRLGPELVVSPAEIESADFVLAVGADLVNEAPMLALSLRQAFRKGARVVVVDPRPVSLPFDFTHIAVAPEALGSAFLSLVKTGTDPGRLDGAAAQFHRLLPEAASRDTETITEAARSLRDSRRPVIVCGTDIPAAETVSHAADAALLLAAAGKQAGLFYVMPGANAFGAGMLVNPDHSLAGILEAAEQGAVRALILVESDPFATFADRGLLERAFSRLELLIVLDHLASAAAGKAQVFLPTQTLFEAGGLFVNAEGRVQASLPAGAAGRPVTQVGGGSHPPRVYGAGLPGAGPRPAWQLVARLSGDELPEDEAAARGQVRRHLCEIVPELGAWADGAEPPADGIRRGAAPAGGQRFGAPPPAQGTSVADGFDLLFVDSTFGTEELSAGSPCLEPLAAEPFAGLNRRDAAILGVADGDRVSIRSEHGALDVKARLFENMARGVIVVPRHRKLAWQALGGHQLRVGQDDVRKVRK